MIDARSWLRREVVLRVIKKALDELKFTKNVAPKNPIAKNRDSLSGNAQSLQRWAIESDSPILYNNK